MQKKAVDTRVKVVVGSYQIGDEIKGKVIKSFGSSWTEVCGYEWVQVTDDTACAYGMEPGLDYYPRIKVKDGEKVEVCYAYFY